jgi:hypothetical protein
VAAKAGNLPPDFDQWNLVNKNGVTVREVYEASQNE